MRLPGRRTILLGILVLLVCLYVERASRPLPLKSYNILLMNGGKEVPSKLGLDGMTHIRSRGFCTEIWKQDVIDTVVCTPHIVSEVEPEIETPKREEKQADGRS